MEKVSKMDFRSILFNSEKSMEYLADDEKEKLKGLLARLDVTDLWDVCAQFGDDETPIKKMSTDKIQGFCSNEEVRRSKHFYEPNQIADLFQGCHDSWGLRKATDNLKRNLERTVIVLSKRDIEERKDDIVVNLVPFKGGFKHKGFPMSENFAYYDRYYVKSCYGSGFLLDDDTMITAGHVFGLDNIVRSGQFTAEKIEMALNNILIIRNFASEGASPTVVVPKNQVYQLDDATKEDLINLAPSGKSYGLRYVNGTEDWAWVKVKAAYDLKSPLSVPSLGETLFSLKPRLTFYRQNRVGNRVYCLGHSLGMPVKAAYRGMITSGKVTDELFTCKLVTLPGNSGSPVFDASTHELIGIL